MTACEIATGWGDDGPHPIGNPQIASQSGRAFEIKVPNLSSPACLCSTTPHHFRIVSAQIAILNSISRRAGPANRNASLLRTSNDRAATRIMPPAPEAQWRKHGLLDELSFSHPERPRERISLRNGRPSNLATFGIPRAVKHVEEIHEWGRRYLYLLAFAVHAVIGCSTPSKEHTATPDSGPREAGVPREILRYDASRTTGTSPVDVDETQADAGEDTCPSGGLTVTIERSERCIPRTEPYFCGNENYCSLPYEYDCPGFTVPQTEGCKTLTGPAFALRDGYLTSCCSSPLCFRVPERDAQCAATSTPKNLYTVAYDCAPRATPPGSCQNGCCTP